MLVSIKVGKGTKTMPIVPMTIILAALKVAEQGLVTFNNLPEELRVRLVNDALDDKADREAAIKSVGAWFKDIFSRIDFTK